MEITGLVCVRNSAELLEGCLVSLRGAGIRDLVVVDGKSSDNSVQIASAFTSRIFSDEGRGLGYARGLGVGSVKSEFCLIASPDDVLLTADWQELVNLFRVETNLAGILARKRSITNEGFWNSGQNDLYEEFTTHQLRVIGNPSLYRTKLLRDFGFDDSFNACEDTDLCERWARAGYKVAWGPSSFVVMENLNLTKTSIDARYRWYGQGDGRFIAKWLKLKPWVAIRHAVHPFVSYGLKYPLAFFGRGNYTAGLFSIYVCLQRYFGLVSYAIRKVSVS